MNKLFFHTKKIVKNAHDFMRATNALQTCKNSQILLVRQNCQSTLNLKTERQKLWHATMSISRKFIL
jgi:hypothetical protein